MRTAKAYAAGLAAVLAALTPLLPNTWSQWVAAVLAVLAALGITWRVPNAPTRTGGLLGVLDAVPALLGGGGATSSPPAPGTGESAENP